MTRDEILEHLRAAPPPGQERVDYFHRIYSQITGWITTPDKFWLCEFLPGAALAYPREMTIVEVGTFGGSTARGLMALTGGRITSIDNWKDFHPRESDIDCDTGAQFFWKNVKTYGPDLSDRVDALIEGDSKIEGLKWTRPIDLLFVDGDHSYHGALTDLQNFAKHVVQGGYCLVDDYDMPPVKQACEFFGGDWETIRVPTDGAKIYCARRR